MGAKVSDSTNEQVLFKKAAKTIKKIGFWKCFLVHPCSCISRDYLSGSFPQPARKLVGLKWGNTGRIWP